MPSHLVQPFISEISHPNYCGTSATELHLYHIAYHIKIVLLGLFEAEIGDHWFSNSEGDAGAIHLVKVQP